MGQTQSKSQVQGGGPEAEAGQQQAPGGQSNSFVQGLIGKWFGGGKDSFAAHLAKAEEGGLTEDEWNELRAEYSKLPNQMKYSVASANPLLINSFTSGSFQDYQAANGG